MATAGPNGPSAASLLTGTGTSWLPGGASLSASVAGSDDVYDTAALSKSATSRLLLVSGFGFAIPAGATINGVVVEVERAANTAAVAVDNTVKLAKASVMSGTDHADTVTTWPTADAFASYGGATDLWGTTLTPADVNAAGFGVVLQVANGGAGSVTARVDYVRITVYYSPLVTTITGTGIASAEALGADTITATAALSASGQGIPTAEAFGPPILGAAIVNADTAGIPTAEAFGVGTFGGLYVMGSNVGLVSGEAWGLGSAQASLGPAGIPTAEAFGAGVVIAQTSSLAMQGIASAEAWGAGRGLVQYVAPLPLSAGETWGPTSRVSQLDDAEARRRQRVAAGSEWQQDSLRRFVLLDPATTGSLAYGALGRGLTIAAEVRNGAVQTADDDVAESLAILGAFAEVDPIVLT